MPTTNVESGFKPTRLEWVAETDTGVAPTDPAWNLFSDIARSIDASLAIEIFGQRGLGSAVVQAFKRGAETADLVVAYELHDRDLTADALEDGLTRDADNNVPNTHTVVERMDLSTGGGSDGGGIRLYTVALGGVIGTTVVAGSLSPPELLVTLSYAAEKLRSYQIDQPSASETMDVVSSDAADTTQTLTIENEGASTTEGVALNGTTPVTSTASFADMDAAHLDAETAGDVTITGTTSSALFMTIRGTTATGADGDQGVPLLGSGSHASAIGGTFADFASNPVQWGGSDLASLVVESVELTVNNNLERLQTSGTRSQKIFAGPLEVTATAPLVGIVQSHTNIDDHVLGTEQNLTFPIGSGANKTITATGAIKEDPGSRQKDPNTGIVRLATTFRGKDVQIS